MPILAPYVPIPIPLPPITIPGYPQPSPGIAVPTPTLTPGIALGPILGPPVPGITDAFAKLFQFDVNWKYVGAVLVMLLSVNLMETWYPNLVWLYVGVLILGIAYIRLWK